MAKAFQVDIGGTLTTNLVSYYKLEDVNDFYASNNLSNIGTVTFGAGKVNNCADLGASNSSKKLTTSATMGIDGGAISIAGWFNLTTAPTAGNQQILAYQSNNTSKVNYYISYVNTAGTFTINCGRDRNAVAAVDSTATSTMTTGTWYHIALTYNGTNVNGYLNGSSFTDPQSQTGDGSGTVTSGFYLGDYQGGGLYFSGKIDEVGVWSKALSATEVSDLYNGGSGQTMVESGPTNMKTFNGLVTASVKTINGLAIASVKTVDGLT